MSRIEARRGYGGVQLTCEAEEFNRITEVVLSDPAVASALTSDAVDSDFQFVSIRRADESVVDQAKPWYMWACFVLAMLGSTAVTATGLYTIINWMAAGLD